MTPKAEPRVEAAAAAVAAQSADGIRYLSELTVSELQAQVDHLGRELTGLRERVRQAGEAAQAALARRDPDAVAAAVAEEAALQKQVPDLEARLDEARRFLEAARKPVIVERTALAHGAMQGWVVEQRETAERIEMLHKQLAAAVQQLGQMRQRWRLSGRSSTRSSPRWIRSKRTPGQRGRSLRPLT